MGQCISLMNDYSSGNDLIILAGTPPANELLGISLVTTAPAAMTTLLPIVTPGVIVTLPPIQTSSPILTGLAIASRLRRPLAVRG